MTDAPTTLPGGVAIRPATREDTAAAGRLGALLVRMHHEFDARRFMAATADTEAGYGWYLGTQLESETAFVLVAESGGTVVGYAYAGMEGRDYMALRDAAGAIYDVVVDPAHRKLGIGRALLDAAVAERTRHGARQFVLSTADRNTTAQRLFERAGFRRTMIEMTRDL